MTDEQSEMFNVDKEERSYSESEEPNDVGKISKKLLITLIEKVGKSNSSYYFEVRIEEEGKKDLCIECTKLMNKENANKWGKKQPGFFINDFLERRYINKEV